MVRPSNLKDTSFTGIKQKTVGFVEHAYFSRFITVVILINAVSLGLETDSRMLERFGDILHTFDKLALVIFTIELLLKLFIYRLSFFRAGWNVFDFIIVGIALIPASGPLAVLRTLRILRVLRLVSVIPSMRRVIAALLHAIPGMASIMAVLMVIYYVCSVLATKLFHAHPDPDVARQFESIAASMYTLFQIMTLEGWSQEIVRPVMDVYPYSWLFFIPFIIVTSFAVLNLFIGIIVDAMNIIHEQDKDYTGKERRKKPSELTSEVRAMREEMDELKTLIKQKI